MLEEYVAKDDKYRAYAHKICGCNDLKNDIVNEMYIRLHKILKDDPSKEISDGYIYMMLKSIFLNQKRDNREHVFDNYIFEAIDENELLEERMKVNETLNRLPFFQRELLLKTQEIGVLKLSQEIGCWHSFVGRHKDKAMEEFKSLYNG